MWPGICSINLKYLFKEIILDGPFGKTNYYAKHIKFEERCNPHVHSFKWIFNAPNIQNEEASIELVEKTMNGQLPDHLNNPEF